MHTQHNLPVESAVFERCRAFWCLICATTTLYFGAMNILRDWNVFSLWATFFFAAASLVPSRALADFACRQWRADFTLIFFSPLLSSQTHAGAMLTWFFLSVSEQHKAFDFNPNSIRVLCYYWFSVVSVELLATPNGFGRSTQRSLEAYDWFFSDTFQLKMPKFNFDACNNHCIFIIKFI